MNEPKPKHSQSACGARVAKSGGNQPSPIQKALHKANASHRLFSLVINAGAGLNLAEFPRQKLGEVLRNRIFAEMLMPLFDELSLALQKGDPSVFHEVADLIKRLRDEDQKRMSFHVLCVLPTLRRKLGAKLTKLDVREAALRQLARDELFNQLKIKGTDFRGLEFQAALQNGEIERQISEQIERRSFPPDFWTPIYKECEIENLPPNKGGRPRHKPPKKLGW